MAFHVYQEKNSTPWVKNGEQHDIKAMKQADKRIFL